MKRFAMVVAALLTVMAVGASVASACGGGGSFPCRYAHVTQ